jgi:hypothetical protein
MKFSLQIEIGKMFKTVWEKRNTYRLLVGKPEGKRPLERPRHIEIEACKEEDG